MYKKYDNMKRYDELAGLGVLPNGASVKFADGTTGIVIQGYTDERSLVQFSSGKGAVTRDVYSNAILSVKA